MQTKILKGIYKSLLSFLNRHLPVQIKTNSKYKKKHIIKPILRAEIENTTIESSTRRLNNISSDDVFYHLNKMPLDQIIICFNNGIECSFSKARKKYRLSGIVDIAIDIHEIPYYGKDDNAWIIGGKQKNGTNKFIKVISLCVVVKGIRYTVCVIPFHLFDIIVNLLEHLIQTTRKYITINVVLLDRGFLSVDNINRLYDFELQFITPIKKNDKVLGVMNDCILKGVNRTQYTMKSSNSETTFDLVVYETEDDVVGFATNIPGEPKCIGEMYRKRWGIETSYRMKNMFYGRTCSRKIKIRILLILLSFMLYNFWVLANSMLEYKEEHITAGDMCVLFVDFIENAVP